MWFSVLDGLDTWHHDILPSRPFRGIAPGVIMLDPEECQAIAHVRERCR